MNPLSPAVRRKSECVGLACGVAGGALAVSAQWASMALSIVSASIFAGALGNLLTDAGNEPGLRPRAGIRAGVVAAVVAGGAAVLCFTIKNRLAGFVFILPALLAVPASAFFGLLGSLAVSMIQNPHVRPIGQWEPRVRIKPSSLLIGTLICSAIGFASPFIALFLPKPTELVATGSTSPPASAQSPAVKPFSELLPAAPPRWKYEAPTNFAEAHAGELKVMKEILLGRFESPLRISFANDGHTFAFAQPNSMIAALDLNEPETTVTFRVPASPQRFAFSPDAKRLFCITTDGANYVLTPERTIRLPLPTHL